MKRFRLLIVLLFISGAFAPLISDAAKEITLLLVPREDVPVKIGVDVGNRLPTLLLTYTVHPNGAIVLQGWNGNEWVGISGEAYQQGTFFPVAPTAAVLVEVSGKTIPDVLVPSEKWCSTVYRIGTVEPRALLHLIGRCYDFKYKDWKWFSGNYGIPMSSINPDGLNVAWYQKQFKDNLGNNGEAGMSDFRYLVTLRAPAPPEDVPEPVVLDPVDDLIPTGELPSSLQDEAGPSDEQNIDAAVENPFTNAVPEAVIIGEAAADEEGAVLLDDDAASIGMDDEREE
ncbi:MAG: hypothetical protein JXR25_01150 [Pontiellaceae bacterium]|nr:hypothetical protein [Pontiellaceae bacterium]MBN2783406.1 hypothetical protein [Pontiellaceae bacterium]